MRTGSLTGRVDRLERAAFPPEAAYFPLTDTDRVQRLRSVLACPSLVAPAAYARICAILDGARTRMRAAHGIH